jgi:hypothetical protein
MAAKKNPEELVPEEEQDTTVSETEETGEAPAPVEDAAAESFEDAMETSETESTKKQNQARQPKQKQKKLVTTVPGM